MTHTLDRQALIKRVLFAAVMVAALVLVVGSEIVGA
jgi:hypothetical protein